jgi:hypothetical protein
MTHLTGSPKPMLTWQEIRTVQGEEGNHGRQRERRDPVREALGAIAGIYRKRTFQ